MSADTDDRDRRLQALLLFPVVALAGWSVVVTYDPGQPRSGTVLPALRPLAVGYVGTAKVAERFG